MKRSLLSTSAIHLAFPAVLGLAASVSTIAHAQPSGAPPASATPSTSVTPPTTAAPPASAAPSAPPGAAPYPYYPPPGAAPPPYGAYPPGYYPYPYYGPPPGYGPPMLPPDQQQEKTRWYGWQILIPGLTFNVAAAVGGYLGFLPVLIPGLVGSVFSAPIVHWAHGHGAKGAASFGINFGTTGLATALWFIGLFSAMGGGGGVYYVTTGIGVGVMITGTALDAAYLGREPVNPYDQARAPKSFTVSLAPLVLPRQEVLPAFKNAQVGGLAITGTF